MSVGQFVPWLSLCWPLREHKTPLHKLPLHFALGIKMKLWISGELDHTVAESYRLASIEIEDFVNAKISSLNANEANEWDVIAIVRDDDNFEERVRFSKRDGMDLRLVIPYKEFLTSTPTQQKLLIIVMLERSLELILNKYPKAFDSTMIQQVLNEVKFHA